MKFSEQKSVLESKSIVFSPADYQYQYLSSALKTSIDAIRDKCVYHLYSDLTQTETDEDYKTFLGSDFYRTSNEFARDCLEVAFYAKHIYGGKIRAWTDSALKCFDSFLIRYINKYKKELIPKSYTGIKESDVYRFLIKKGGDEYEIGIAFQSIYRKRNEFAHVQIEESDGIRRSRKWSNKQYNRSKENILEHFKKGLTHLSTLLKDLDL